jgi:RsiW-degrading membrane proteinase PrsW (M82 family)
MFNPRLLTPPQQEEEIYPYRPVWRSVAIESGIVGIVTIGLFIFINLLHPVIPLRFNTPIVIGVACLPIVLWLYFSFLQERTAPQPRRRLLAVALISALVANAVGIPLVNEFLQVDRWLPLSSAISRIIGYTFTVGIVQEFLKYLVLRYVAWPVHFRIRKDGVAYGAAAGIGYATVLNLHFAFTASSTPDVAASYVFANYVLHLVTGILVGYGLSELQLGHPTTLLPLFTVAVGALITGISIPIRAGLINATLALGSSASRPILGIIFSVVLLLIPSFALSFMYNNAERQAQEIVAGRDE